MITTRVEKHNIKPSHPYYTMLDEFCFKSKNLYNFANYQIRQTFTKGNGTFLSYYDMDRLLKTEGMDYDYRSMPTAQSSQHCLRLLENNWKVFFVTIKDWTKNKDKYSGKPKLPSYLDKTGRNVVVLPMRNSTLRSDGTIRFPKTFNGFTLKTKVTNIQQVRFVPRKGYIKVEVVYRVEVPELAEDNGRCLGIDIGVDNIATVSNNFGEQPIIINGKPLKAINQYYNKQMARQQKVAKQMNDTNWTNKMTKLTTKRNNMIENKLHKASKSIIDYALSCEANTIVIGNNKGWKIGSKLSKKVNQKFVGVPHQRLIRMIQYKAENVGINVILTEESYTSGTSFLDGEMPIKANYNKSRRKYRGLFVSNEGEKINADVNGSLQIIKKVLPNAFSNGIEDVGLHPIRVTV